MKLSEAQKRFGLSDVEVSRIEEYLKQAETAEIMFCDDHEYEYYDFSGGCPACLEERQFFEEEMEYRKNQIITTIDKAIGEESNEGEEFADFDLEQSEGTS
jgi:hypothetical protein